MWNTLAVRRDRCSFFDDRPVACTPSLYAVFANSNKKSGYWSSLNLLFEKRCVSHVGQIDQIDHDLDHLDPSLPLGDVVPDL